MRSAQRLHLAILSCASYRGTSKGQPATQSLQPMHLSLLKATAPSVVL